MSTLERLEEYAAACREALDNRKEPPVIPDDLRDLRGVDLRGADLRWADLRWANIRGADLRGANLRGTDLSGVDLSDADLRGADLYGAYLRGANLCWANICGADLRDANLCGANLMRADLRGANLRKADLRGAEDATQIEAACYPCWRIGTYIAYGCECWPLVGWPLDEAEQRHPGETEAHAEVRSIVTRLISKS